MHKQPSRRQCRLGKSRVVSVLALLYGDQPPLTPQQQAELEAQLKVRNSPQLPLHLDASSPRAGEA